FGGLSVGLTMGLAVDAYVGFGTVATVVGALAVTAVIAAVEVPARGVHAGAAWPFLLAGLLQPGIGQIFVTYAIRDAGAARASVVLGSAPLVSVTIALLLLGEPVRAALIGGAVLIVAESLWGVLLALLLIRRTELVGRHVVAGALLVVAGAVLIGVNAH